MSKQGDIEAAALMQMAQGLHYIHNLRDNIARFLSQNSGTTEELIRECDKNRWDESVAFDFRAALFQLGCVLATLVLWDGEVLPHDESRQKMADLTGRLDEEARRG